MFPVAILAGGLATRLHPITDTIPKALVEVSGQPFIKRQLLYLREQGISEVVLCIGYLGDKIRDLVGDGEEFGLRVSFSQDGAKLLGTGGALKKAIPLLGDKFFVLYGDSYLPIDFKPVQRAYEKTKQPALMTVLKNQNKWDESNVLFIGEKLLEYNKRNPSNEMTYIDYGLGVLSASIFEQYNINQTFDLADLYHCLSMGNQLSGFEVHDRFFEIGSHTGLKETEKYFTSKEEK